MALRAAAPQLVSCVAAPRRVHVRNSAVPASSAHAARSSRHAGAMQLAPARARGRSAAGRRAAATPRAAQGKGKGKGAAPATQRYTAGSVDIEMPLAAVQQLPLPLQAAVVAGIFAGIGLGTYVSCTAVAPGIEQAAPSFMAFSRATWPLLGATFVAAGVAHFTAHDAFVTMMPTRGAWGVWYLPGSPSFHVNWTGVAEIAGGAGVLLGAVPAVADAAPWLGPTAAYGLFWLTWAVTPANVFMFTHNAPGPGPAGAVIPVAGHAVRGLLQVFLLSTLWGLAHPPS